MATMRYGTTELNELAEKVIGAISKGSQLCIVFVGGDNDVQQSAAADLAKSASLRVDERDASKLVGERPLQTQGYLREAFDDAGDVPTILILRNADAVFEAAERQIEEDDLDADAHTPLDYMFERIEHKAGVTILHLADPEHVERVAEELADAVVHL